MKKIHLFLLSLLISIGSFAETVSIAFSSENPTTSNGITLSFDKANGTNAPSWSKRGFVTLYAGSTMTVKAADGYNIQQVGITLSNQGSFTANTGALTGNSSSSITWTGKANEVVFTVSGSSSSYNRVKTPISVTYSQANSKQEAKLAFSQESYSINLEEDEFTPPTLTAETDGALTFTSSDERIATVDAKGHITLTGGSGLDTITVKSAETDTHDAGEAKLFIEAYKNHTYHVAKQVKSGGHYLIAGYYDISGKKNTCYASKPSGSNNQLFSTSLDGTLDTIKVKDYKDTDPFTFTDEGDGNYSIKSTNGLYLYPGGTTQGWLKASEEAYRGWTLTLQDDGSFKISSSEGYYIQRQSNTFVCYNSEKSGCSTPFLFTMDGDDEPQKAELTYAFAPADSSAIAATDSIKLWLSRADALSYTGVKFAYTDSTDTRKDVVVEKASIVEASNADGSLTLAIPTPADLAAGKALNVKVSLYGQENIDGTKRDTLAAVYNLVSLKIAAPAVAGKLDKISGKDSIKVQLPTELEDQVGVVYYHIVNITTGETEHTGYMNAAQGNKLGNGLWGADLVQDYVFYEGNSYAITAKAYCEDKNISAKKPVAADSIAFAGSATKENTDTIVDSTPLDVMAIAPDTTSADGTMEVVLPFLKEIAVTYGEDIKLNAEADQVFVVERPRTTYAYTTSIAEDGKTLLITLNDSIKATDNYKYINVEIPEGYVLSAKGNKTNSRLIFYYTVGKEVNVEQTVEATPADGSTVESIKEIVLAFPNETYANAGQDTDIKGTVTNEAGEAVATFNCYRLDMGDNTNELKFSLREAITTPGTYTITFPAGIVQFGEQADRDCKEFKLTYTISTPTALTGVKATATPKATIFTLDGKKATKATKGLYIINGKKAVVK